MLARIFVLVVLVAWVFEFALLPIRIAGISMEPTLSDRQVGFLNRLAYQNHLPQRGDLVGFRTEQNSTIILKRVVGLPGERIALHSGTLFINGVSTAEPYLVAKGSWEWPEETLPADVFFVMGDNRSCSQQFRVNGSKILGKLCGWHP
jgi:signal peptidase I